MNKTLLKYVASIVLLFILAQTSLHAYESASHTLSPQSRINNSDFKELYTAASICMFVEEEGKLKNNSNLSNLFQRLEAIKRKYKNVSVKVLPYEIIVEIQDEGMAVRYFDPTVCNVITPYSDIRKLSTKIISPQLNRQIIHRVNVLGGRRKEIFTTEYGDFEVLQHKWQGKSQYRYHYSIADKVTGRIEGDKNTKLEINEELRRLEKEYGFSTEISRVDVNPGEGESEYRQLDFARVYRSVSDNKLYLDLTSFNPRSLHQDKIGDEVMAYEIARRMGVSNIAEVIKLADGRVLGRIVESYSEEELLALRANDAEGLLAFYVKIRNADHWDGQNLLKKTIGGVDHYISYDHSPILDSSELRSLENFLDFETFSGQTLDPEVVNRKIRRLIPITKSSLEKQNKDFLGGISGFLEDTFGIGEGDIDKIDMAKLAGYIGSDKELRKDIETILGKIYSVKVQIVVEPNPERANLRNSREDDVGMPGTIMDKRPGYVNTVYQIPEMEGIPSLRVFEIFDLSLTEAESDQLIKRIRENPDSGVMLLKEDVFKIAKSGQKGMGIKLDKSMGIIPDNLMKWLVWTKWKKRIKWIKRPKWLEWLKTPKLLKVNIGYNCPVMFDDARSDPIEALPLKWELPKNIDLKDAKGLSDKIYISPTGLFRIKVTDPELGELYLVALNESAKEKGEVDITPIGGGYRFSSDQWVTRYSEAVDMLNKNDKKESLIEMRKYVKREDVLKYLDLFHRRVGREITPVRELEEELVDELKIFSELPEDGKKLKKWAKEESEARPERFEHWKDYLSKNKDLVMKILAKAKRNVLLRVSVESLETMGAENAEEFLSTFQSIPYGFVELYHMSGVDEADKEVYGKFGLKKQSPPKGFKRTRENTITLFPAFKGEKVGLSAIVSRLGSFNMNLSNTVLSPIGLQHDPVGLIRSTMLGLRMVDTVRQINRARDNGVDLTVDQEFKDDVQVEIVEPYKSICDLGDSENFDLTPDDIIGLVSGTVNDIVIGLNKIIKLLPATPIDTEELRKIFKYAKQILMAA